jgi:hypothetical protein
MASTTYLCLGSPENPSAGLLELDLVVFREKGEQTRYLHLSFAQPDENNNMKSVSVNLNEESFKTIQEFFKQLDWNS